MLPSGVSGSLKYCKYTAGDTSDDVLPRLARYLRALDQRVRLQGLSVRSVDKRWWQRDAVCDAAPVSPNDDSLPIPTPPGAQQQLSLRRITAPSRTRRPIWLLTQIHSNHHPDSFMEANAAAIRVNGAMDVRMRHVSEV